MFLKEKSSAHLVELIDLSELFDPHRADVTGRYHYGEEAQDPEHFKKANLMFPSGEELPRCWTDAHYRDEELRRHK